MLTVGGFLVGASLAVLTKLWSLKVLFGFIGWFLVSLEVFCLLGSLGGC